jgi:RimJ/RimL family protein N-acetyltransferase
VPGAGLVLRRWRMSDVDAAVAAVERSLPELRRWMPWAMEPPTRESLGAFLERAGAEAGSDVEMGFGLFEPDGELVGGFGLHARRGPGVLEIGYWVRTDRTGRGYATAAVRALTAAAFDAFPEVDRVEIRCDPANAASAAIPPKLGYRLAGEEPAPIAAAGQTGRHLVWAVSRSNR